MPLAVRGLWALLLVGCAANTDRGPRGSLQFGDAGAPSDLAGVDFAGVDFSTSGPDLSGAPDLAGADFAGADLSGDLAKSVGPSVITGGPCASGAAGATAIRVRWLNSGGTATVQYDAFGLPDHSREKVSAYGNGFGFTPQFDDPYLGDGGLVLDGSDFVDMELSTSGVSSINQATIAIRGRSFDTTTSGSFNWMSFSGSGTTATDFVANSAPYEWYAADLAGAVVAGDGTLLLRIKAGPSSGVLVVNQIEICLDAS